MLAQTVGNPARSPAPTPIPLDQVKASVLSQVIAATPAQIGAACASLSVGHGYVTGQLVIACTAPLKHVYVTDIDGQNGYVVN